MRGLTPKACDLALEEKSECFPMTIRSTMSMTQSPFTLPLSIAVLSLSSLLATGQQPIPRQPPSAIPGQPPVRARVQPPGGALQPDSDPQPSESLSANYRITFSGKSDEKSLGELSSLTCSRNIMIEGPLNSSDTPTTFSVSGTLEEDEGLIIFNYAISFRCPVITNPPPGQPPVPGMSRTIQYQDHTSRGILKMKPGKPYDLLRAGGNVYSIVVAPEIEK
jgi:hypothetical protein